MYCVKAIHVILKCGRRARMAKALTSGKVLRFLRYNVIQSSLISDEQQTSGANIQETTAKNYSVKK